MVHRGIILFLICLHTSAYILDQPDNSLLDASREKRQIRHQEWNQHTWNRDIPVKYTFNGTIEEEMPFIREALDLYSSLTCITFEHTTGDDYRVIIGKTPDKGCRTSLGDNMWIGSNYSHMWLDFKYCDEGVGLSTLFHEIQHLFGYTHVMQSPQGKEFFKMDGTKLNLSDFGFEEDPSFRYLGQPIDVGSLMLYFSANDSIVTREQYRNTISNVYPPYSDLRLINMIYKCPDLCAPEDLFRCARRQGLPDSRNCSTCLCPNGFEGPTCTARRQTWFGYPPCGDTLYATDQPQNVSIIMKKSTNLDDWNNGIHKFLAPRICVWHVRSLSGKKISLTVSGEFNTTAQARWLPEHRYWFCVRANLEIQLRNFDLTGQRYCTNLDIAEIPPLVSDDDLAVIIATSARDLLPPLNVTYVTYE